MHESISKRCESIAGAAGAVTKLSHDQCDQLPGIFSKEPYRALTTLPPSEYLAVYYEDFEVGSHHPTYSRTITEGDLSFFCAFVGYHVPLFIDEEYAKKSPYGGRIAPSSLTMSISTGMTESLMRTTVVGLLGVERGRFLGPVRPGDTITTDVEVIFKRETKDPSRGIVTFRDHVTNQRGELVFEIDKIVLIQRKDAAK